MHKVLTTVNQTKTNYRRVGLKLQICRQPVESLWAFQSVDSCCRRFIVRSNQTNLHRQKTRYVYYTCVQFRTELKYSNYERIFSSSNSKQSRIYFHCLPRQNFIVIMEQFIALHSIKTPPLLLIVYNYFHCVLMIRTTHSGTDSSYMKNCILLRADIMKTVK